MSDLTAKLTKIKERIDETRAKTNRLEGEQKGLMTRLEDDHDCASVKEAQRKLTKLGKEIEVEQPLLQAEVTRLEEAVGI